MKEETSITQNKILTAKLSSVKHFAQHIPLNGANNSEYLDSLSRLAQFSLPFLHLRITQLFEVSSNSV